MASGTLSYMKPLLGKIAILAAALCLFTACLDVEETVTIYPDGSGKVEGTVVYGEELSAFLDMAAQQGNRELEKSILEGMGFSGDGVYITACKIVKEDKKYHASFTALCRDVGKATRHDGQSPTPPCKTEKQKNGSFVFTFGDERDTGTPPLTDNQEIEMTKAMLKDFKLTLKYLLPGEITEVKDPSDIVSHDGRTLTISIDANRLTELMKQGKTGQPKILKVTCAAPTAEVEAELTSFRAELEKAVENAKQNPPK